MGYRNILLAVDFGPQSSQVCDRARELATCWGGDITLLHVVTPLLIDPAYDTLPPVSIGLEKELVARARSQLQALGERYGVPVERQRVELGSPKLEIIRMAEGSGADLIVVGSHGRHGISLLLGSTANGVLHGAPCDVLAVRVKPA